MMRLDADDIQESDYPPEQEPLMEWPTIETPCSTTFRALENAMRGEDVETYPEDPVRLYRDEDGVWHVAPSPSHPPGAPDYSPWTPTDDEQATVILTALGWWD